MKGERKLKREIAEALYYQRNEMPFNKTFPMFREIYLESAQVVIDLLKQKGIIK